MRKLVRPGLHFLSLFAIALVATSLAVPSASAQQLRTYAFVPGIPGDSQDIQHPNWIEIVSLQQDSNGANKKNFCEIDLVKGLDSSGPRLWAAAVLDQVVGEVRIEIIKPGESAFKVYDIRLQNTRVAAITTTAAQTVSETVALRGTNMTLTYTPQKADGSPGTPITTTITTCN